MANRTKTLLEKAKESGDRRSQPVSPEEIELALAWANGEIGTSQCARAYGINARVNVSQVYNRLAMSLREYIRGSNGKQK